MELIYDQTLRGRNLTKNLVAFAKDQEPKQEFFKISDKTDLVVNLMKKDLEGIDVTKEDRAGVPDLLADPGMIEHALVNLLQNSIHSVSKIESPKIIIRTYCLNKNICIEMGSLSYQLSASDATGRTLFSRQGDSKGKSCSKNGRRGNLAALSLTPLGRAFTLWVGPE